MSQSTLDSLYNSFEVYGNVRVRATVEIIFGDIKGGAELAGSKKELSGKVWGKAGHFRVRSA